MVFQTANKMVLKSNGSLHNLFNTLVLPIEYRSYSSYQRMLRQPFRLGLRVPTTPILLPKRSIPLVSSTSLVRFNSSSKKDNPDEKPKPVLEEEPSFTTEKKYQFMPSQKYSTVDEIAGKLGEKTSTMAPKQLTLEQQKELDETYAMAQRFQLALKAIGLILVGVLGYEGYKNWKYLKTLLIGGSFDMSHFDEVYEEIKRKKALKEQELEKQTYTITDPNDSSVPGLYVCGNNKNQMTSDDPQVKFQTIFKRLPMFDNFVINDVALGDESGALIDGKGDLYQWGKGFKGDSSKPTISGERLISVKISNGVVYALTKNGEVLYIPQSSQKQKKFNDHERGWFASKKPYGKLQITKSIKSIVTGTEHIVLLSQDGSVYTAATGLKSIEESHGQFGIPSFSQFDQPPKVNEVHEVTLLNKYRSGDKIIKREIKQIAAGDAFTLCLDTTGYVWAFGKNTYGAVGQPVSYDTEIIPYPSKIELISSHYKNTDFPQCIEIAAGGDTAFAAFVSSNIYRLFEKSLEDQKDFNLGDLSQSQQESMGYFAWGHGLKGELGVGHFVHGQAYPSKIQTLNKIKEFNEQAKRVETTGVKSWSVGKNHIFVTLNNDDVYAWGDNEFGQLGNGKRIRSGVPSLIPPLLEPVDGKTMSTVPKPDVNSRLQLKRGNKYQQVIVAGRDTTAIYYSKN